MDNNTSNEKVYKVSTRISHLINSRQAVPCALDLTYYDDMVRVQFAPELPQAQQTDTRRYDYEKAIITALTRVKCNELCNAYNNVIRPAIMEGKNETISVPLAGVNLLLIGTGVDEEGKPHPYILFCKDLDPTNLMAKPENRIMYEFNTGEYILGYNHETGEYKERVVTCNEIDLFFHDLENVRDASSNAYVHTDRVVNRYYKDTVDSKLNRIGEKLGLDLATRSKYSRNGGGGKGSVFDKFMANNSEGNNASTATHVSSIDEIDDLMKKQLGDDGELPL